MGTFSLAVGLALAVQGEASPIIRFDSREQGRTFYVDTDRDQIRKALRDVSAPSRGTPGISITSITRQPGRGGAFHANDATRTAVVSVSPGAGPTDVSVNWRPKVIRPVPLARSAQLVVVWYDDTKQILRVRDPATGWQPQKPADMRTYASLLDHWSLPRP